MDNSSIESLKLVRSTNQDLLNFFNDSYISKLEQVQSLKTEEFELKAKIDQLIKTLDVYSFKTSTGHNVFSPFSANTTSQQEKATQIELQLEGTSGYPVHIKAPDKRGGGGNRPVKASNNQSLDIKQTFGRSFI